MLRCKCACWTCQILATGEVVTDKGRRQLVSLWQASSSRRGRRKRARMYTVTPSSAILARKPASSCRAPGLSLWLFSACSGSCCAAAMPLPRLCHASGLRGSATTKPSQTHPVAQRYATCLGNFDRRLLCVTPFTAMGSQRAAQNCRKSRGWHKPPLFRHKPMICACMEIDPSSHAGGMQAAMQAPLACL